MDEWHGKMSGQPGKVKGPDTSQRRKDFPDLVERALWIQDYAFVDGERIDSQRCSLDAVEKQQCP